MLFCRCSRTPTLSTLSKGEVELISGVRLVPAQGHTTDDCVVRFGLGSWQASFLTDTILASSQLESAERIAVNRRIRARSTQ
jgi:hypothetical protein